MAETVNHPPAKTLDASVQTVAVERWIRGLREEHSTKSSLHAQSHLVTAPLTADTSATF